MRNIKEYLLPSEAAMLDKIRQFTPSFEFLEPISDEEEGIEGYQEELQEEESNNGRDKWVISHSLKRPIDILDLTTLNADFE